MALTKPRNRSSALRDELPAEKPVRLMLHAPTLSVAGVSAPMTVLAVTGDGWLIAAQNEGGDVRVDKCSFTDTLLVLN
jgi:hypothetical protein